MKNKYLLLVILFFAQVFMYSCALNPKYTEPNERLREQAEKYPKNSEQIKAYQQDFESYQNYKRITEDVGSSYQVISIKDSSWYFGQPDSVIGIGNTNYHYLHKIGLVLVCGELKFDSRKFSNRKIDWQLTDKVKGNELTNLVGKINLIVRSETDKKFDRILIMTTRKNYSIQLGSSNFVELDKDECD